MNTIGHQFNVTSFGESHGSHVGCVINGCPAGLLLDLNAIQHQVNRRKTNQTSFSTSRNEHDQVDIISGVFESKTTGSPIAILIKNSDARSADYDQLKDVYRPNHADFTNEKKYGWRDYRGGGRSSIRITAPLVAAGEIARQLLSSHSNLRTTAFVSQIGKIALKDAENYASLDFNYIDQHEVRCPDIETANQMMSYIEEIRLQGDTLGGIIQCVIQDVPVGLGEPVFGKLQAMLSHAMLSINSVKGFDYGGGFSSISKKGSEYNDRFQQIEDTVSTSSNNSGGIQGGISNGMDIYFRVAFKPISSIQQSQQTIDQQGNPIELTIGGRHDVCAVPRAVPIVEAYTNIVLADAFLLSKLSKI